MKYLLILFLLICSGLVLAEKAAIDWSAAIIEQQYLCITEVRAGLWYNEASKKWTPTPFDTGDKYLVKVNDKNYPKIRATVTKFGAKMPINFCDFKTVEGHFICDSFLGQFVFNEKTLRFIKSYIIGYHDEPKNNNNTPYVAGGTCAPL